MNKLHVYIIEEVQYTDMPSKHVHIVIAETEDEAYTLVDIPVHERNKWIWHICKLDLNDFGTVISYSVYTKGSFKLKE